MVFDISGAKYGIGIVIALKLAKNFCVRFFEDIDLNIEPATMGHPQNNFSTSLCSYMSNKRVQHGNERFRPFQGKACLSQIFLIQELLKQGGLVEFVENPGLLFP